MQTYFHRLRVVLLATGWLLANILFAQDVWTATDYLWEEAEINVPNGTQYRYFTFMTADEQGYIWTARDQVARFDGIKFQTIPDFTTGLQQGEDLTLTTGPDGMIWLARHSATGSLGYHEQFVNYSQHLIEPATMKVVAPADYFMNRLPPVAFSEVINVFCQSEGQDCYLGLQDGNILRYLNGEWRIIDVPESGSASKVQHVAFARDNHRWMIYPDRCLIYDPDDRLVFTHAFQKEWLAVSTGVGGGNIVPYNVLELYFNPDLLPEFSAAERHLQMSGGPVNAYADGGTLSIKGSTDYFISEANPYAYLTDDSNQEIVRFPSKKYNKLRLVDRQGRYWFATIDGFLVGTPRRRTVNSFLGDSREAISVRAIIDASPDSLWLNTYSGTYKVAYPTSGREPATRLIHPKRTYNLGLNKLPDGKLISGQHSSHYSIIDPETTAFTELAADVRIVGELNVHLVYADSTGALWGLGNRGVLRKPNDGAWSLLPNVARTAYNFAKETKAGIWIAGNNGLLLLDKHQANVLDSFPELNAFAIYHFVIGEYLVYLATDQGLIIWDRATRQFNLQNLQSPGLPPKLHSVYRHHDGFLYCSTNHGIFRYNPVSKTKVKLTVRDGMSTNECNWLAHFQSEDSTLFFGTIQGVVYFHPDSLRLPSIVDAKDSLRFDRAEVLRSEEGFRQLELTTQAGRLKATMKPYDVLLRLGVSLPGNSFANGTRLRYRLLTEGIYGEWIPFESGLLRVNRPAPGEYLLEVEGVHPDGTFARPPQPLQLVVLAPIYKRGWFTITGILTALAGFLLFFRNRRKRYLQQQQEITEKVIAATAQLRESQQEITTQNQQLTKLNEEKRKLLTVIAHDLKGPLTSLQGVGGKVRYLLGKPSLDRLDALSDNIEGVVSGALSTLNNLLLANGSAELTTKMVPFDLSEAVEDQLELLVPLASMQKITLTASYPPKKCTVRGIPYAINSLIRNLVMNAIKFSPPESEVSVSLRADESGKATLKVTDQGRGVTPAQIDKLLPSIATDDDWEPSATSSGLGWRVIRLVARQHDLQLSVVSTLNEGTTVTVCFNEATLDV